MSELQVALSHAVKLALVAVLAGLVVRGRARLCWSFAAYLARDPGRQQPRLLLARALLHRVVLGAEAGGLRRPEDGGRARARLAGVRRRSPARCARSSSPCSPCSRVSTVSLGALTPPSSYMTVWEWQPGVATAALWLLTATALLVVWYQVPVHDWQRAIMLGLAPYLLVFVTLLDLLRRHGWAAAPRGRDRRHGRLPRACSSSGPGPPGAATRRRRSRGARRDRSSSCSPRSAARSCATRSAATTGPSPCSGGSSCSTPRSGRRSTRCASGCSSTRRSRARPSTPPSAPGKRNRVPDALTVLRVALSILEEAGADRLTRLRAMGVYSRMVRAIQPLPPPAAAPFRGPGAARGRLARRPRPPLPRRDTGALPALAALAGPRRADRPARRPASGRRGGGAPAPATGRGRCSRGA